MLSKVEVFITLLSLLAIAFMPAYIAFRIRANTLLIFSLISGFLFFLVIPWIICLILVNRKISKDMKSPIHFCAYSAFWCLLIILYMTAPLVEIPLLGSLNGYQILFQANMLSAYTYSSEIDDIYQMFAMFPFICIIGFISSLFFRRRAVLSGNVITLFFAFSAYFLLSFSFLTSANSKGINIYVGGLGLFILLFPLILAIACSYYMASQITNISYAESGNSSAQQTSSLQTSIKAAVPAVKNTIADNLNTISSKIKEATLPESENKLQIHCISGQYASNSFKLQEGETLYMGSSPQKANLIFTSNEISRLHCTIMCTEKRGKVCIVDNSTNGTYISSGVRLPLGIPTYVDLPCCIFFGNTPEMFEITN